MTSLSLRHCFTRKPLTLALSLAFALPAWADTALEEVIVTAQKRVEKLHDVPVSIVALSGSQLAAAEVEHLEDFTKLVPNIHLTQTGISTQLRVRGIGSDNSQGFEQSVGVYKNGIYHSRAQLLRAPMFDMERVEFMRGPQGTLFGKNSIAGALDMITARPGDTLVAKLDSSYETEFATQELTGVISSPITDTLKGRLALRWKDDPGYFKNSTLNVDQADQEDSAARASLDWQPVEQLSIKYTGERDRFDVYGRNIETVVDLPSNSTNSFLKGKTYAQIVGRGEEANRDYVRQSDAPEYSHNRVSSQSLVADLSLPNFSITSATGLVKFNYDENCDCDFSPVDVFQLLMHEDYSQLSQEVRLTSTDESPLQWLAGVFYQTYDQTYHEQFKIDGQSVLVTPPSKIPAAFGDTGIRRHFTQSSDAWAAFGQASWQFNNDWRVILGGRFTKESKDGTKKLEVSSLNGDAITNPSKLNTATLVYKSVFKVDTVQTPNALAPLPSDPTKLIHPYATNIGHDLSTTRDETAFTPSLKIQYDLDKNTMLYASYSKGFKAGGFDPRSNSNAAFEFSGETARAYETGVKTYLLDGRLEINADLFRTDYTNLQISQFDGKVGFNVGNAKSTQTQGLEVDGRWAMTQHVNANFGLALLDFEYKDFKNGNCSKLQVDANAGVDTDGDTLSDLCDYTGKRGVYTPKYTANTGFEYHREIAGFHFTSGLDLQFVDSQNVHANLDPNGEIDAYTMLGLQVGLAKDYWHLALMGSNLLDEYVPTYMSNLPLSDTSYSTETLYGVVRRPRTLTLAGGVSF